MTNLKVLGAIVIVASALSSSAAFAQACLSNPDMCEDESASYSIFGSGRSSYGGGQRYRPPAYRPTGYDDELAWHGLYDEQSGRRGSSDTYAGRNRATRDYRER
jgi:hypothetical protein